MKSRLSLFLVLFVFAFYAFASVPEAWAASKKGGSNVVHKIAYQSYESAQKARDKLR